MWRVWLGWAEGFPTSTGHPDREMQTALKRSAEALVSSQLNWSQAWAASERDLRRRTGTDDADPR
jgi:hypothetical protein